METPLSPTCNVYNRLCCYVHAMKFGIKDIHDRLPLTYTLYMYLNVLWWLLSASVPSMITIHDLDVFLGVNKIC